MRIHAIQTGTVRVHQRQVRGSGSGPLRLVNTLLDRKWTDPLPIFAWLIEHPEGPIVVDTGETAHGSEAGYYPPWHPYFRFGLKCSVEPEEEIGPQLGALGISPDDVRWVVLTHLHTDHAGGLHHFPNAEILVSRREYETARGLTGQLRGFLSNRWPEWFTPTLIDFANGPYGPFRASHILTDAGDVVLVPTHGHTRGHLSVVLNTEVAVFFAGDASYTEQLMLEEAVDGVSTNVRSAGRTLRRIRQFVIDRPAVYLPAHDPDAASRLAARRLAVASPEPAQAKA